MQSVMYFVNDTEGWSLTLKSGGNIIQLDHGYTQWGGYLLNLFQITVITFFYFSRVLTKTIDSTNSFGIHLEKE